jgi:hypothetical protein
LPPQHRTVGVHPLARSRFVRRVLDSRTRESPTTRTLLPLPGAPCATFEGQIGTGQPCQPMRFGHRGSRRLASSAIGAAAEA